MILNKLTNSVVGEYTVDAIAVVGALIGALEAVRLLARLKVGELPGVIGHDYNLVAEDEVVEVDIALASVLNTELKVRLNLEAALRV